MFFIMKFNQQLFAAAKPVAMAFQRGDDVGVLREAARMSSVAEQLAQEAARKAGNAMISGNDDVYASMAYQASKVAEAGRLIASADLGNGTLDRDKYLRGRMSLEDALSG